MDDRSVVHVWFCPRVSKLACAIIKSGDNALQAGDYQVLESSEPRA